MKKVLLSIFCIIFLVAGILLVSRCATIANTFEITLYSDIDLRIEDGDVYRRQVKLDYKKGLTRTASAVRSSEPTFYTITSNGKAKEVKKDNYFISFEYTFQGTDGYNNVYPEITIETTNKDNALLSALRVMIVNGDKSYLFAPGIDANDEYKAIKDLDNGKPIYNDKNELVSKINTTSIIDRVDMYQEITLKFYVWYELADSNYTNFKAKGKNTTKIQINFNR